MTHNDKDANLIATQQQHQTSTKQSILQGSEPAFIFFQSQAVHNLLVDSCLVARGYGRYYVTITGRGNKI